MDVKYLEKNDWIHLNDYLSSKKAANIYHLRHWKDILATTYKFSPHYIIATENNHIKGFLPLFKTRNLLGQKKLVSLPYSHFVPILYDSDEACRELLISAESIAQRIKAEKILIKSNLRESRPKWEKFSENYLSILDLRKDIKQIRENIRNSTRRNIKKAEKENVNIKIGRNVKDYRDFYELMVDTRKRQGVPPYPRNFFEALYGRFDSEKMRLFQAFKNERLLSGIIMFYYGDRAIYAYGASVNDKVLMRSRPNELLFWKAILDAWEKGYSIFDFGITPFFNTNLLHFKSRWGVNTHKTFFTYFSKSPLKKKPVINRGSRYYMVASKMLEQTPRPMIKILGPQILKYFGY